MTMTQICSLLFSNSLLIYHVLFYNKLTLLSLHLNLRIFWFRPPIGPEANSLEIQPLFRLWSCPHDLLVAPCTNLKLIILILITFLKPGHKIRI